MKITDYPEWNLILESLKTTHDSLGTQLLSIDPTPDNLGKIGDIQGSMKMILHIFNLPKIIWPDENIEGEGEE